MHGKNISNRIRKYWITGVFVVLIAQIANGQMQLEENTNHTELYIFETRQHDTIFLDTLPLLLGLYSEYTYQLNESGLFLSWSSNTLDGKTYYIFKYIFNDFKKLVCAEKMWVDNRIYGMFYKNELIVKSEKEGLLIKLSNGKIRSVTLEYKNVNKEQLKKLLKVMEEF